MDSGMMDGLGRALLFWGILFLAVAFGFGFALGRLLG